MSAAQQEAAELAPGPTLPKFIHPDDMPDVYALTGEGTCMLPLIEDGGCCVFDKRVEPQPGDVVALIYSREAARRQRQSGVIKRLVTRPPAGFDGWIVVEQINPERSYWVPTCDVLAVHKFVGTATSQGNGQAVFDPNRRDRAPTASR